MTRSVQGGSPSVGTEVPSEWRQGWRALVGAMGAIAFGGPLLTYTAGMFVKPIEQAEGWSRTEIAFGGTCMMFAMAAAMPFIGALTDRYGSRRIGAIGLSGYGLSCLALSGIPAQPHFYYAALIVIALFSGATNAVVFSRVVVAHFTRWRGLALGLAMSGTAVVLVPLAPAIHWVLDEHGWRAGYMMLGLLPLAIGLPCALLVIGQSGDTRRADKQADAPAFGLPFNEALRTSSFWKIMLATVATTIPLGGFLSQMSALLSDKGQSGAAVAGLASFFVAMVVVGRSAAGLMFDRFHAPAVAFGVMTGASVGAMLLLQAQPSLISCALSVALIGAAMGGESDIQAYFSARQFGLRAFSTIFGAQIAVSAVCMGIGALLFGAVYDANKDYALATMLSAIGFLGSGIVLLLLPKALEE